LTEIATFLRLAKGHPLTICIGDRQVNQPNKYYGPDGVIDGGEATLYPHIHVGGEVLGHAQHNHQHADETPTCGGK
jgi:hypothetical protein